MNIKTSQTLVSEALNEIKTISPDNAFEMSENNQCNLIDIRDIRELEKEGRIDKSLHIPRGMLEFWLDNMCFLDLTKIPTFLWVYVLNSL